MPLWALVVNNFTFHYAFFILMSWLPTFYHSLGADATRLGALKMLPYLVMGLASNVGGFAADALIGRGFGVTRTRKLLNSAGFAAAAAALLALPGAASLNGAVALACASMGSLALARGGYRWGGALGGARALFSALALACSRPRARALARRPPPPA